MEAAVAKVFDSYPEKFKEPLLRIRGLIYDTARENPEIGEIEENLKWGQPNYTSKKGTPLRLDRFEEDKIALFVHCQTSLIEDFRVLFHDALTFTKNRGIIIDPKEDLPVAELTFFIERALTYHARKGKQK